MSVRICSFVEFVEWGKRWPLGVALLDKATRTNATYDPVNETTETLAQFLELFQAGEYVWRACNSEDFDQLKDTQRLATLYLARDYREVPRIPGPPR